MRVHSLYKVNSGGTFENGRLAPLAALTGLPCVASDRRLQKPILPEPETLGPPQQTNAVPEAGELFDRAFKLALPKILKNQRPSMFNRALYRRLLRNCCLHRRHSSRHRNGGFVFAPYPIPARIPQLAVTTVWVSCMPDLRVQRRVPWICVAACIYINVHTYKYIYIYI